MGVSQRSRCTGISRRAFVRTALIGGASLAMGTRTAAFARKAASAGVPWVEATIPELQELMDAGELTSVALTKGYLKRIDRLNPLLGAVIETNPQAIGIAARRDAERRHGIIRGPLHGIPVLVKDNIATDDRMETTAGSLALVGSRVPRDSVVVAHLRLAGAVILGKANLTEWASFRGFRPPGYGWSARGGFTFNPYLLSFDPCGSSAGSAVATAANLCAVALGTETFNSIVCPAGNNLIVGIKPTIGLVSQSGVIPIAHSHDSVGPMTRTVSDAALLLNVLRSPWGPVKHRHLPRDYTRFLDPDALQGARIGIDRRQFGWVPHDIAATVDATLDAIADAGAEIVDPVDPGDPFALFDSEVLVVTNEFKGDVAAYMAPLGHTDMRSLSDLIVFNREHCSEEMRFFGQEVFEFADSLSGDLDDPDYLAARAHSLKFSRDHGVDAALMKHDLDAILTPSYSAGTEGPAAAGYPTMSVPAGISKRGRPVGIWLYGGFLSEPKLIALGYAIEQLLMARVQPGFAGKVPPEPPDAGICESLEPGAEHAPRMRDIADWMASAGHATHPPNRPPPQDANVPR